MCIERCVVSAAPKAREEETIPRSWHEAALHDMPLLLSDVLLTCNDFIVVLFSFFSCMLSTSCSAVDPIGA